MVTFPGTRNPKWVPKTGLAPSSGNMRYVFSIFRGFPFSLLKAVIGSMFVKIHLKWFGF